MHVVCIRAPCFLASVLFVHASLHTELCLFAHAFGCVALDFAVCVICCLFCSVLIRSNELVFALTNFYSVSFFIEVLH